VGIVLGAKKAEKKKLSVLDILLYPIRYIQNADARKVVAAKCYWVHIIFTLWKV
jgi:hypothetical protein